MKTTFISSIGTACSRCRVKNWPSISLGARLRPAPKKPVTQNVQPTAHPACEERQTLVRSPIGMYTASMRLPSSRAKRYFRLPSAAGSVRSTTCGNASVKRSARRARRSFGTLVMASNDATPRACTHSSICFTRKGGATTSPSVDASSAGATSCRLGSLVVTGSCRKCGDTTHRAHLSRRVDAEGAKKRQVVDVDAELDFLVALDDQLRRRRCGVLIIAVVFVQTDGRVEDHVEVVALVADALDVAVDVVGAGDRFVDRRSELTKKLLDFVVHVLLADARKLLINQQLMSTCTALLWQTAPLRSIFHIRRQKRRLLRRLDEPAGDRAPQLRPIR